MGILGFDDDDRLQLEAAMPGIDPRDVQDETGFHLGMADNVVELEGPSEEQLEVLRTQVDQEGYLRE
jgi:glutaconate CoA-transferase subunit B